jgi:small-conductance mechanosensitive channel
MIEYITATPWVAQAALILAGLLAGILTERFLIGAFHRLAERTQSTWDDLLIHGIRWMPLVWWSTAGVWAATQVRGFQPPVQTRVNQALVVVVIVSFTIIAIRLASGGITRYAERSQAGLPSTSLVNHLISLVIGILGLFLVLQNLNIEITPLITALGIGGLAVALALQDTLSNLFAGVSIIVAGQVRKNDYIRLESGEEGFVTDVKARNTTIRTFPHGNLVVVPNGVLASTIVTNYSLPQKSLWIAVPVGVAYDSDLEHVERVAIEVGRNVLEAVEGRQPPFEPLVRYQEFGDSSINLNVLLSASKFTDQFLIRHEFIKKLHVRFGTEGIEIPFPIRTLHIRGSAPVATDPSPGPAG